MGFLVTSFAKPSLEFVRSGESEYLKRLQPLMKTQVKEYLLKGNFSEQQQKTREAALFWEKAPPDAYRVLLDERGRSLTSLEFAGLIERQFNSGNSDIHFAIGGTFGWTEEALARANLRLSLSALTFTYQFSRLILLEQLYRAMTIIRGLPYNK
jgi:23S rRNA (pseudouridine1915-N3)-methyltransferase